MSEEFDEPAAPLPGESSGPEEKDDLFAFDSEVTRSSDEAEGEAQAELEPETLQVALEAELAPLGVDLDEDLFDFADLLAAAPRAAGPSPGSGILDSLDSLLPDDPTDSERDEHPQPALEMKLEPTEIEEAEPVAMHDQDMFEGIGEPTSTVEEAEPQPAPAPEPLEERPARASRATPAVSLGSTDSEFASVHAVGPMLTKELLSDPMPPAPRRKYLVEALAVAFVLVNGLMILIAWHAASSFQSTIEDMEDELAQSVSAGNDWPTFGPTTTVDPAPDATDVAPIQETKNPLVDYHQLELELARQEIGEGQHGKARRRLYRLLSNQDRVPVDQLHIQEAEFLVAESYFREAQSLERGSS